MTAVFIFVLSKAPFNISGDACVDRFVDTFEHVDEVRHIL